MIMRAMFFWPFLKFDLSHTHATFLKSKHLSSVFAVVCDCAGVLAGIGTEFIRVTPSFCSAQATYYAGI